MPLAGTDPTTFVFGTGVDLAGWNGMQASIAQYLAVLSASRLEGDELKAFKSAYEVTCPPTIAVLICPTVTCSARGVCR